MQQFPWVSLPLGKFTMSIALVVYGAWILVE
ncbi:MAG: hypothetical protein LAT76_08810 [Schleiferiaceae bacterium]|nr:hypothetical protein [Schleiferiaceae bacterium]